MQKRPGKAHFIKKSHWRIVKHKIAAIKLPYCVLSIISTVRAESHNQITHEWTTTSFDSPPEGSAQKVNNASTLQFKTKYVFAFKTI